MDPIPYKNKYCPATKLLKELGVIKTLPVQYDRDDMQYDDGVDVEIHFVGVGPEKLHEYHELICLAAEQEANRYASYPYKMVKVEVELNLNTKGRESMKPKRLYIAAKHPDPEVLVWGVEALGYEPDEPSRPYLIDRLKEILGIPQSSSPGPYVKKQRPYKVVKMQVCARVGRQAKKEAEQKLITKIVERTLADQEDTKKLEEGKN